AITSYPSLTSRRAVAAPIPLLAPVTTAVRVMPGSYAGTLVGMARGDAQTIERVLAYETWAVVGLTANPRRPAYGVARFLQQHGKRIVPVNPRAETVHGEPGYASLADVPFAVDVVDVFRRSDKA